MQDKKGTLFLPIVQVPNFRSTTVTDDWSPQLQWVSRLLSIVQALVSRKVFVKFELMECKTAGFILIHLDFWRELKNRYCCITLKPPKSICKHDEMDLGLQPLPSHHRDLVSNEMELSLVQVSHALCRKYNQNQRDKSDQLYNLWVYFLYAYLLNNKVILFTWTLKMSFFHPSQIYFGQKNAESEGITTSCTSPLFFVIEEFFLYKF